MKLEKITELAGPVARRSYHDACGAAHALDLIGERWALLVIRELLFGPKRFGDLRSDLPGISANVLTQRLDSLEATGLLIRRKLPPPASIQVYELTPWGYESEPIFVALGRWATRSPEHDPRLPLSAVSLLLSFRTMFDSSRSEGMESSIGFVFGAESFVVRIASNCLHVSRASTDDSDVVFSGPVSAVAAAIYGGVPLDGLIAQGALSFEGDQALADRFVRLFPLPAKNEREA